MLVELHSSGDLLGGDGLDPDLDLLVVEVLADGVTVNAGLSSQLAFSGAGWVAGGQVSWRVVEELERRTLTAPFLGGLYDLPSSDDRSV